MTIFKKALFVSSVSFLVLASGILAMSYESKTESQKVACKLVDCLFDPLVDCDAVLLNFQDKISPLSSEIKNLIEKDFSEELRKRCSVDNSARLSIFRQEALRAGSNADKKIDFILKNKTALFSFRERVVSGELIQKFRGQGASDWAIASIFDRVNLRLSHDICIPVFEKLTPKLLLRLTDSNFQELWEKEVTTNLQDFCALLFKNLDCAKKCTTIESFVEKLESMYKEICVFVELPEENCWRCNINMIKINLKVSDKK